MFDRRFAFVLAVVVIQLTHYAQARAWNVLDHGAIADGTTDVTAAFQSVLDLAGSAGGGTVVVPSGEYRFDGSLVVPFGVTLQGSYEVPSTFQPTESPKEFAGTTFLVYGGRGSNAEPAFIRLAGKMAALRGVLIRYPEATIEVVPPEPYPPTILMNQWVTTVENVCLLNSYEGIRLREAGRHLVRNVHGYPTWRGITVDWIQDVGRIENCHFSPMGFPFEPEGDYMQWVFEHGIAFEFHQSDWQYVTNTFCFGYNVGYRFGESKMGTVNGNFLGIAADSCRTPVLVDQASPVGVLITNGEFVGQWDYGRSVGIDIAPGCKGTVNLNNCAFWGPFDRLIRLRGGEARLVATACNFESWDNDGDDSEAIQIDAGRAIIQGSFFREGLSNDAVRKAKLVKGNGSFGRQTIFQSLLKNLETIDRVTCSFAVQHFYKFTQCTHKKSSIVGKTTLADINDIFDFDFPGPLSLTELAFIIVGNSEKLMKWGS